MKTCKTEIEDAQGGDRATADSDRDAALAACQSWADTCKSTCPAAASTGDDPGAR